jgi:transcriptional regulator GlxA family with amidase domain
LLLETDLPIAEIAAACGFADQSHLSKVFARENGEPPAAWRRRNTS